MCEDGTFETARRTDEKSSWLVYEESFLKWVHDMDHETQLDLGA
ncbi:MAG: hypothetical protein R2682_01905 [Pyrinomonadaceae bacterium]